VRSKSLFAPSEKFALSGIGLLVLGINPFTSFEPFNAPKFLILLALSFTLIFSLIQKMFFAQFRKIDFLLKLILILFIGQSTLSLLFSEIPIFSQLFGIDGRNTGFLTYFSSLFLFVYYIFISNEKVVARLIKLLIIIGILNGLYGLMQFAGQDPFEWTNSYSPVFGFFGNPNFQSALMGIAGSAVWALFLVKNQDIWVRMGLLALQMLFVVVIVGTRSQQGFLILISGLVLSIFFSIKKSLKFGKFRFYYLASVLMGAFITLLDILQKVPWTSILYKVSVSNRGDLWRSAWRMAIDHPIFGVGFDSYEYFYRQYRDETAIVIRGAGTTSNSAHNVFLDILTIGGFPLFFAYCALTLYVFFALMKLNARFTTYQPYVVATGSAWFAFQLQSLISINQIGLAIWGWVFGGALIGLEIKTRESKNTGNTANSFKSPNLVMLSIGIAIGFVIGYQPMKADIHFRQAIESRKIELVLNSAYEWPQSPQRMFQVAGIFRENKLDDLSYKVAKDAVKKFPRSFENWELLYSLANTPVADRELALQKMKSLDPKNPALK
jgi:O-antigen ligase